ncbi:unnamed protein product [Euphydryas editha]|uniref:DDE-1 domain-containing protein n=1 Tax=Euphydryas editha TaxID=104508 RepID=A0AAU9UTB2_EUPED|nr:unnamed protein product [Euphydryas editha]
MTMRLIMCLGKVMLLQTISRVCLSSKELKEIHESVIRVMTRAQTRRLLRNNSSDDMVSIDDGSDKPKVVETYRTVLSIRKSTQECKLPYPTLRRYVLKYLADDSCSLVPNYEVNTVFTTEQENELQHLIIWHNINYAPPHTLRLAAFSGWMTAEIFKDVMKHFFKHFKHSPASKENPALLIRQSRKLFVYTPFVIALKLAKSSRVTILTLHPHTTANMQPLVGLGAPFKRFYNSAVDSWLIRNPGKKFTIDNVAESIGDAYLKSMTSINIVNAFKKCGIYPFDDTIFTDIYFMPSLVTDRSSQQPIDDETDLEEQAKDVEEIINKVKRILRQFKQSNVAWQKLKKYQEQFGNKQKRLIQEVATRWNSNF